MTMMPDRKPLLLLQYGRGLAALAVAAFHLSLLLGDPRYLGVPVFYDLTWRGNLGVDFFFVLSGFIIFYAHERDIGRPERLKSYFAKRFTRLYPVYWVYVSAMCILLALNFGSATSFPQAVTDWLSTLLLVRFDSFELPITPAWSLMHEVTFYALFGLLIMSRRIGWPLLALWMVTILIAGSYSEEGRRTAFSTYFSAFNLDFAIGIAAFYASKKCGSRLAVPAIVAGVLLLAGWYILETHGIVYRLHPLGYAACFGLIVAGLASFERERNLRPIAILKLLGDASYSIYLTHLAFLGVACKVAMVAMRFVPLPPAAVYVVVLAAAIIGGCLAHLLVEKPVLSFIRRKDAGREIYLPTGEIRSTHAG
nr:acyltransferase [Rhizobium sp. Q54]